MRKIKSGPSAAVVETDSAPRLSTNISPPSLNQRAIHSRHFGQEFARRFRSGLLKSISYRIPAFKYKKVLVWYAAFADHCSLFPTASIIETIQSRN